VGHVVGAGVSRALFGGSSSEAAHAAPASAEASVGGAAAPAAASEERDVCEWQLSQFRQCVAGNAQDISMCQGLADALTECRRGITRSSMF
jgi:hypothetical protein